MMHFLKLHIKAQLLLLLALFLMPTHAATPQDHLRANQHMETDSMTFSLITCGQGDEIYSLFGHTAIRYQNPARQIDVAFNYGVFDFDTPHFALRFALGETDYLLGVNDFRRLCAGYAMMGRSVNEQVLNLTTDEKLRLLGLLEENYRPENRTYRYNFFYDNCATRPRNLIERAISSGTLHYAEPMDEPLEDTTFRTLLHRYSTHALWSRFGMDLCMGSKADRPITRREMEFVPFCLRDDLQQAVIIAPDGSSRPLVSKVQRWNDLPEMHAKENQEGHALKNESTQLLDLVTPSAAAIALLLVVVTMTLAGTIRRRHTLWVLDLILLTVAGISGCILAFLTLFSQHPCVDHNWMLLALHPLHLLCLPCTLRRVRKGLLSCYQIANLCSLTLFIIVYCLKIQIIPLTAVYLALCLLIRAIANLWLSRQHRLHPSLEQQNDR